MLNTVNNSGSHSNQVNGFSSDILDADNALQSKEKKEVKQKANPLSTTENTDTAVAAMAMANVHAAHSEGIIKNIGQIVMEKSANKNESLERINADTAFLRSAGVLSNGPIGNNGIPPEKINSKNKTE